MWTCVPWGPKDFITGEMLGDAGVGQDKSTFLGGAQSQANKRCLRRRGEKSSALRAITGKMWFLEVRLWLIYHFRLNKAKREGASGQGDWSLEEEGKS